MSDRSDREAWIQDRQRARLLLLACALAAALLLLTVAVTSSGFARKAAGTRALIVGLVQRAEQGQGALGADTPEAYALARDGSQPPAATAALQRAADLLSADGRASRLLGVALGSQGRYGDAERVLAADRAGHPEDPFTALALANVIDSQGRTEEARALWQDFGLIRPLSYQLHRAGARLASAGQRANGEAMLLLAIEIDPTFADPYHTLGGFYWSDDRERSLALYRTSLALGGLEPFFVAIAEGKVALLEDRPDDAVIALAEAVRLRPDHVEANQFLGTALHQAGRSDEAIPYLERAATLAPQSPWPLLQLGQVYLDQAQYASAIAALAGAAERQPSLVLAFDRLAQAQVSAGQLREAARSLAEAVRLQPDSVSYHMRLGELYVELGMTEEAVAAFRAALELAPTNEGVRRQLQALGVAP